MKRPLKLLMILVPACLLAGVGCEATRAGYESAPYEVLRSEGRFDVRAYPALLVAETGMAGQDGDGSFRRLFRFISGRNEEEAKIAMTTPVFMVGSGEARTMAFVMPSAMEREGVPEPSEASVDVRELEGGTFAAMRFSGSRNDAREARALAELREWLAGEGMVASGTPIHAYFDPPWTPTFLRRNEVMLRVAPE